MSGLWDISDDELIRLYQENPAEFEALYQQGLSAQVDLARRDINAFNEFVLRDERTQEPIEQAPDHYVLHHHLDQGKFSVVWGHVESGKLLDLDTEIPTANGFKRLRDVGVGDFVVAMDGSLTRVVSETPPETPVTYLVTFSDGSECVAGADHQWLAWTADRFAKSKSPTVVTTQEMLDRGLFVGDQAKREYPARKWRVPIAAPVQYPCRDLPLDPYFVGAWLGDGTMASAEITGHVGDVSIATRCMAGVGPGVVRLIPGREHLYRCKFSKEVYRVLRQLGVTEGKFIPAEFLTASIPQRLELLRGIMDTDGSISRTKRNWCEVSFANERLANDTIELVRSLGWRATLVRAPSRCGDFVGERWRVTWTGDEVCPFHLARKVAIWLPRVRTRDTLTKTVVSIELTTPRPMKCLGVQHPTHTYLIGRHYTVTHNCVTADTLLVGEDTQPITAGELYRRHLAGEAQRVWTVDHQHRAWRLVPVRSVFDNGERPCVRVTTVDGHTTTVTWNHPFLAGTRLNRRYLTFWRDAINLTHRSYVFAPGTHPRSSGERYNILDGEAFGLGFVLGLVLGKQRGIRDSNLGVQCALERGTAGELHDVATLARGLARSFGWVYDEEVFTNERLVFSFHQPGRSVSEWLRQHGVWFDYQYVDGEWQRECCTDGIGHLPAWVWRGGDRATREFLLGFSSVRLRSARVSGHEVVGVTTLEGDAPVVAQLFRREGVAARVRASHNDLVWGRHGGWAAHVGRALEHLGVGHEHLAPLAGGGEVLRPLTMRPSRVVRVERVGVLPTLGIEIDDPQHTHVTDGILTHNTQQVTIGRVLKRLGDDPTSRIVILQSSADVAKDSVTAIKDHIENNPRLHMVYPDLKPGDLWTSHSINIARPYGIRTPSVQARGAEGRVLGNRYNVVVVDDLLTLKTTRTEYMRKQIKEWFLKEVLSRLLSDGEVWFLGNALNPYDLMHDLVNQPNSIWRGLRLPVRDPVTGESRWPKRWPQWRIEEYAQKTTPAEVARALDCIARSEEDARFREEWIDTALAQGAGLFGNYQFAVTVPPSYPPSTFIATGVDLAFSTSKRADYTVLFTAAFHANGTADLLDIQRGKWEQGEVTDRLVATHRRFRSTLYVESVAAQRLYLGILQSIDPTIPVYPHQTSGQGTTTNKHHRTFGLEAFAFELSRGLWRFPVASDGTIAPVLSTFIQELLASRLNDEHDSDMIMAAWMCLRGARDRGGFTYEYEQFSRDLENPNSVLREYEKLQAEREETDIERIERLQREEHEVLQRSIDSMWANINAALATR